MKLKFGLLLPSTRWSNLKQLGRTVNYFSRERPVLAFGISAWGRCVVPALPPGTHYVQATAPNDTMLKYEAWVPESPGEEAR